jgi:hypothetical protein
MLTILSLLRTAVIKLEQLASEARSASLRTRQALTAIELQDDGASEAATKVPLGRIQFQNPSRPQEDWDGNGRRDQG